MMNKRIMTLILCVCMVFSALTCGVAACENEQKLPDGPSCDDDVIMLDYYN